MLITDLLCQYCDYGKKYHMYLNRANSEKMGKTAYHIPSHTIAALTVFTFFAYVKYPVIPPPNWHKPCYYCKTFVSAGSLIHKFELGH